MESDILTWIARYVPFLSSPEYCFCFSSVENFKRVWHEVVVPAAYVEGRDVSDSSEEEVVLNMWSPGLFK